VTLIQDQDKGPRLSGCGQDTLGIELPGKPGPGQYDDVTLA
jgi:hypothetical protein